MHESRVNVQATRVRSESPPGGQGRRRRKTRETPGGVRHDLNQGTDITRVELLSGSHPQSRYTLTPCTLRNQGWTPESQRKCLTPLPSPSSSLPTTFLCHGRGAHRLPSRPCPSVSGVSAGEERIGVDLVVVSPSAAVTPH